MATYYAKNSQGFTSKPVGQVEINHDIVGSDYYSFVAGQGLGSAIGHDILEDYTGYDNYGHHYGFTATKISANVSTLSGGCDTFSCVVVFKSVTSSAATDIVSTAGALNRLKIYRASAAKDIAVSITSDNTLSYSYQTTGSNFVVDGDVVVVGVTYDGSNVYTIIRNLTTGAYETDTAAASGTLSSTVNGPAFGDSTDNRVYSFTYDRNNAWPDVVLEQVVLHNEYLLFKPQAPQYIPIGAAANDAGGTDALTATSVESASTVSSNTLTQVHSLTATSVESASTVSSPTLAEGSHVLTATSVESASTVSTNTLTQEHALTATSVESASTVSTPTLTSVAGTDVLTAVSVESASTVSTPTLGQTHVFTATSVETTTEVTTSSLTQVHILAANDVEAASTLSAVAIDRAELTSSEVATLFVSNANYYRAVSNANIYRVDN